MSEDKLIDRDSWTTPKLLFSWLDKDRHFDIDAAASDQNALCSEYYSKENSALLHTFRPEDKIFCNPPYSMARQFAEHFLKYDLNAVLLLPVRSDRLWFQRMIHDRSVQVCWITGRVHFGGSGKGAFMYSIIVQRGFEEAEALPDYIGAENFNDKGRGGART